MSIILKLVSQAVEVSLVLLKLECCIKLKVDRKKLGSGIKLKLDRIESFGDEAEAEFVVILEWSISAQDSRREVTHR